MSHLGPPVLRDPQPTAFAALVRSITFQQLAGRAAAAIHARLLARLGGTADPGLALALGEEAYREAGLSSAKTASIRDLAGKVLAGEVRLESLDGMDDEEVIAELIKVRGVGRWTAEMFLIFQLRRPDVWPAGDLGVRRGLGIIQALDRPPKPAEMSALGDPYRPWRSIAAWYCWRATEVLVPD